MAKAHFKAVMIGVVAGMRCFSALAFTSRRLSSGSSAAIDDSNFTLLSSNNVLKGIAAVAAGELICDKTSFIPDRIDPGPITGRAISGAICGAVIFTEEKKDPFLGAAIGGLSAIAAAHIFFRLRRELTTTHQLPDTAVALCEDALMLSFGLLSETED